MLRRHFGQVAVAIPAAGLLAAHHQAVAARSASGRDMTGQALTAFTNPVTTIVPGWQVAGPSGDKSGATDTTFLNNTLTSLGSGASLWLAPGEWFVNGPVLPLAGQRISGLHGASQSGDGASSDQGTVIFPVGSSWPSSNGLQAVFAYPSALSQGEITDLWIDCTKFTGSSLSGVAAIGSVNAISLHKVGVYSAPSDGFSLQPDASNNVPDGWLLDSCLSQTCGGAGFNGKFNDASFVNCHAQSCGGDGFAITSANAKLIGCRGDLCSNGFTLDIFGGGGYNDATVLSGCGTQRNNFGGLNVINSSTGGDSYRTPVVVEGCTFGGDGYNGGNPQASGTFYAGIRVRGANTVLIGSTSVTVHKRGTDTNPIYSPSFGLSIIGMGTKNTYPLLVTIATGLLNGFTGAVHDESNGTTIVQFGNGVYGATGYQATNYTVPTP